MSPLCTTSLDIEVGQCCDVIAWTRRRSLQFWQPFCFPLRARGSEYIDCMWVNFSANIDSFLQREETDIGANKQVKISIKNWSWSGIFFGKLEHSQFSAIVFIDFLQHRYKKDTVVFCFERFKYRYFCNKSYHLVGEIMYFLKYCRNLK